MLFLKDFFSGDGSNSKSGTIRQLLRNISGFGIDLENRVFERNFSLFSTFDEKFVVELPNRVFRLKWDKYHQNKAGKSKIRSFMEISRICITLSRIQKKCG